MQKRVCAIFNTYLTRIRKNVNYSSCQHTIEERVPEDNRDTEVDQNLRKVIKLSQEAYDYAMIVHVQRYWRQCG